MLSAAAAVISTTAAPFLARPDGTPRCVATFALHAARTSITMSDMFRLRGGVSGASNTNSTKVAVINKSVCYAETLINCANS